MGRLIREKYFSFIGSLSIVYNGKRNNKNKILIIDSTAELFKEISMNEVLEWYKLIFSLIRNYLCYDRLKKLRQKFFMRILVFILFLFFKI